MNSDKILIDRAVVEQALEALEYEWGGIPLGAVRERIIGALREALSEAALYRMVADAQRLGLYDEPSQVPCSVAADGVCEALECCKSQEPEQEPVADSVTSILLEVVPGPDGMGKKVYATSAADVVRKLSQMAERIEELEGSHTYHAPQPAQGPVEKLEYTRAVGDAGQDYYSRFSHAHPLPAMFRWEDLFNAMVAAAYRAKQEGKV